MKMKKRKDRFSEMVDIFGYDYVIGYCLCQEYDVRNSIDTEEDEVKRAKLTNIASKYKAKANQLSRERIESGL